MLRLAKKDEKKRDLAAPVVPPPFPYSSIKKDIKLTSTQRDERMQAAIQRRDAQDRETIYPILKKLKKN